MIDFLILAFFFFNLDAKYGRNLEERKISH